MTHAVSIRLPQEIDERLDALAAQTGRTKTFYISEADFSISKTWKICTTPSRNTEKFWQDAVKYTLLMKQKNLRYSD